MSRAVNWLGKLNCRFAQLQLAQQRSDEFISLTLNLFWIEQSLSARLAAIEPNEPQSFHQSLIPERGTSNGQPAENLFEVFRPHQSIFLSPLVFRDIDKYDVADDDFRPKLLDVRQFSLQIVSPVGHRSTDILEQRLEGNQKTKLTREFVGNVPVLRS